MEIRRSGDLLISTMGFPILVRWHLNIDSAPRGPFQYRYANLLVWEIPLWKKDDLITIWTPQWGSPNLILTGELWSVCINSVFWRNIISYQGYVQCIMLSMIFCLLKQLTCCSPTHGIGNNEHRSGSTLTQVTVCCLVAPSHYLNDCWQIIKCVLCHSLPFTRIHKNCS